MGAIAGWWSTAAPRTCSSGRPSVTTATVTPAAAPRKDMAHPAATDLSAAVLGGDRGLVLLGGGAVRLRPDMKKGAENVPRAPFLSQRLLLGCLRSRRRRVGRQATELGDQLGVGVEISEHEHLADLHERINGIAEDVSSLSGEFKGAKRTLELIHSFLLNGGKS